MFSYGEPLENVYTLQCARPITNHMHVSRDDGIPIRAAARVSTIKTPIRLYASWFICMSYLENIYLGRTVFCLSCLLIDTGHCNRGVKNRVHHLHPYLRRIWNNNIKAHRYKTKRERAAG